MSVFCLSRLTVDSSPVVLVSLILLQASGAVALSTETLNSKVTFFCVKQRQCFVPRQLYKKINISFTSHHSNDGSSKGKERVGLLHLHGWKPEGRAGKDLQAAGHRGGHCWWEVLHIFRKFQLSRVVWCLPNMHIFKSCFAGQLFEVVRNFCSVQRNRDRRLFDCIREALKLSRSLLWACSCHTS